MGDNALVKNDRAPRGQEFLQGYPCDVYLLFLYFIIYIKEDRVSEPVQFYFSSIVLPFVGGVYSIERNFVNEILWMLFNYPNDRFRLYGFNCTRVYKDHRIVSLNILYLNRFI